ncbi:MAG TPA: aminotransferase class I/II-fold pyridoxal phosphate-dependent enzyme [Bacteroidales bacterium]|nr:aminotransferase class I/II-fold pyridoxal phosphate-dependent enzyme [Bacteroidales bacterium]
MSTKIWLHPPHMSGREEKYVREAFESNWIAPLGPNVDGFESELSRCMSGHSVAAVASGTAAIHLALILLGVKPGDEVLASDFTFTGTVNPILYQGAVPVFVDSEMDTWNMDPMLLEEAIMDRLKRGKKPAAIIVADIYGMPANLAAISAVAEKHGIPVVEDAAEALGSKYKGKPCGTFGQLAALSFNGNKIITTSGGGALVSPGPEMAEKARFLASQAKEKTLHFEHHRLGYNYRMSNVLAGIGRGQLEVLGERVTAHRIIRQHYQELLKEIPGLEWQAEPDADYFSNFWLTCLTVNSKEAGITPEAILRALAEDHIDARPLMKPMHMQEVFRDYPRYLNGNGEHLFANGISLPSGSALTESDRERVAGWILRIHAE